MPGDPHPFLVPPGRFDESGVVHFPEGEAHHILRVVRLKPGDACRVVDGRGGRFRVRLEGDENDLQGIVLEARREVEPSRRLDLGFPVLRLRARTDWLIEKCVEVGVDRFVPISWERSLKGVSGGSQSRWERIIREAMKQSERAWLPELISEERPAPATDGRDLVILADPAGDGSLPDLSTAASVLLLIGPEGGVTASEREDLRARGAALWNLGTNRLRAETAAVVGSHHLACALRDAGPIK
jgi:16S rRNA (uracil1498-N3)-methyltransferase